MAVNTMQYDKNKFKIYALPHPAVLLIWILNPFVMFNELILGLRLPKVTLVDKESNKPLPERTYYPCPHCAVLNDTRCWARRNALGHWFGYICPNCHQIIPCLWSVFSLVILAITFPLWYFPARLVRQRWIEKEKERLAAVLKRPLVQVKTIHWLLIGTFIWGVFMWIFVEFLPQMRQVLNGKEWDLTIMLVTLPIWLSAGCAWGLFMGFWMNRRGKKAKGNSPVK